MIAPQSCVYPSVNRRFIEFTLAMILHRVMLEVGYSGFVTRVFEYAGYVTVEKGLKYAESWAIFFLFITIFPKRLIRPSDYLMVFMLSIFLTPLLVYYGMVGASRFAMYSVVACVTLMTFLRGGSPIRVVPLAISERFVNMTLMGGCLVVTVWMVWQGGLGFFNLDLYRVYEFRRDVGELIDQGPMAYLNNWAYTVFGPTLLAICLWRKRLLLAILVVALHVLWFGISSHKAVLFYPALVAFLWFVFGKTRSLSLVPFGMAVLVATSLISMSIFDEIVSGDLFIRRTFFDSSNLTFAYYDFFNANPHVFWSESLARFWVDYPYDVNSAEVIGRYIGSGGHANNSFLSTGFMHAGYLGVVLYGVLAGLLFKVIDSIASKSLPPWLATAVVIVPSSSLIIGADLPTALLTHGLGAGLLMLYLTRSGCRTRGLSSG